MNVVQDLIRDREQFRVSPEENVMEVVRYMVERHIGAVSVVDDDRLAGIFSERDLMKRVVAEGKDPHATRVADVMTRNPVVVSSADALDYAMDLMKEHGFRHLPVIDAGRVRGLISMRDLLANAVMEKDGEVQMMRAYISGT